MEKFTHVSQKFLKQHTKKNNTMNKELINNVRLWFHQKGIIEKSNPIKQLGKTQEELNETRDAAVRLGVYRLLASRVLDPDLYQDDRELCIHELKDGIGDTVVTLIGVCEMTGYSIMKISKGSLFSKYKNEIAELDTIKALDDIQARLLDAYSEASASYYSGEDPTEFLEDLIGMMLAGLQELASRYNFTLEKCLQQAYDVISKRTGEVVDGVFIKDREVTND